MGEGIPTGIIDSKRAEGEAAPPGRELAGWAAPWLIAALSLTLNLLGNERTGLWDRDEPRYAVAVREMRARGDWMLPTFNGEPRYHKPILIYWLMGLSTALGGDSTFAARGVSALAGTATCVLVWGLGRRMLGARAGWLAGLFLAVAPIMVAESKLATTDATLTLWLVGCQTCLWELAVRPSRRLAAAFWACLGLAFLTKGPVGPAFLGASAALAWWWGWPARQVWRRLHPRWGLTAFVLVTAPWYVHIALVTRGEFFRFAVGDQLVQRVASGMEEHGGFPGYYVALSLVAFYPWSALAPAAILGAWGRRRSNPDLAFLLAWAVGPWILLECVRTKLLHYYLPAFPALALLVAWLVEAVSGGASTLRRWPLGRLGMGLLAGVGLATAAVLAASAAVFPGSLRAPLLLLAALAAAVTTAAALRLHRGETRRAVLALALGWALFLGVLVGWLIPAAEPLRTSRVVGERLAALSRRTGVEPVLLNYQEPGVIYAMGRPIATVRDRRGLDDLLGKSGTMLSVVTPEEQALYCKKYGVEMTTLDSCEGFSLTKGRAHRLCFTLVRRAQAPGGRPESTSMARSGGPEQSLVK